MRKSITSLCALAVVTFAATSVQATPMIEVQEGTSGAGNELWLFNINNVTSADTYDTINVEIFADAGLDFLGPNTNGTFQPGINDETAFNGIATVGSGRALVGVEADATKLTGVITTFGGAPTDTLLGNFAQVAGGANGTSGSYTIQFALAGTPVLDTVSGQFGFVIPEPTTLMLAGFGLLGVVATRRRS